MSNALPTNAPRILITAGPTHEPIDAVRYLGNRSSGKMGMALAEAACDLDLPTTILLGPTPNAPENRSGLTVQRFQTTADLEHLLTTYWPKAEILFMCAAVADFRPEQASNQKWRRNDGPRSLELHPTPDLVAAARASARSDQCVVGWALEPADELEASAQEKLQRKGLDAIVANPLETVDSESVQAKVLLADGTWLKPTNATLSKSDFARWLMDAICEHATIS